MALMLSLAFAEPRPLPEDLASKWKHIVWGVERAKDDANHIILLAEALEAFTGRPVTVDKVSHSGHDMFGGCDIEWRLTSGAASLYRRLKEKITESWSSVDTEADEFRADGMGVSWDKERGAGGNAGTVTISGLTPEAEKRLLDMASRLFVKVSQPS